MYTRVVRFTGVTAEQVDSIVGQIKDAGGPPPGVTIKGLSLLHDVEQGTAVVLQLFDTAEQMEEAARMFDAMDAGDTPGTRVSVDSCEVSFEMTS